MHSFSNSGEIGEVSDGWSIQTVESLCTRVTSGGTPSRQKPDYYINGTIPWYKTKELNDWYLSDAEERITVEALENSSAKLFPAETILMAMYSDGRTITSLGILRKEAATNQACCAMIADPEQCDNHFLLYALKNHRNEFILLASGGSQRNLNTGTVRKFALKVPPLSTQRKISAVLSAYDDLIENNTRRIAILEEMAQALYREWFVHFRFPGHEDVKMVEVEGYGGNGRVPKGWDVWQVKDFGTVITGKTPSKKRPDYYSERYMPFIKTPDMHGNIFCINTTDYLSEAGATSQYKKTLPPDSICVSCIGTVGVVVITTTPSQTNQQINSIILADDVDREYLYFALVGLRETMRLYGSTGATMSNLSKGKFQSLQILKPSLETISDYHNLVHPMFEMIKILQVRNTNLRQTRDLLLPRLISGELDVSDLDIAIVDDAIE